MTYDEWNELVAAAKEMTPQQKDERVITLAYSIAALLCSEPGLPEQKRRAAIVFGHLMDTINLNVVNNAMRAKP